MMCKRRKHFGIIKNQNEKNKSTEIKQQQGSPYTQPLTCLCLVSKWETIF